MSTRIESGNPIQLILQEPSTVIVISKSARESGQAAPRKIPSERSRVDRFIPSSVIREATQEIINFSEDSEGLNGDIKLTASMIAARKNKISFEDINKFLTQDLYDMEKQLGYYDARLDEAKERILTKAEYIWTAPEDELAQILKGLQIPSPRKS